MLCMHGSKHVWSRLIWICDVAKMLESEPDLDWDSALREAKRVGLWRCLALGVLLAHRVAGAQVPDEVLRRFEKDRTARKLAEAWREACWRNREGFPRDGFLMTSDCWGSRTWSQLCSRSQCCDPLRGIEQR